MADILRVAACRLRVVEVVGDRLRVAHPLRVEAAVGDLLRAAVDTGHLPAAHLLRVVVADGDNLRAELQAWRLRVWVRMRLPRVVDMVLLRAWAGQWVRAVSAYSLMATARSCLSLRCCIELPPCLAATS